MRVGCVSDWLTADFLIRGYSLFLFVSEICIMPQWLEIYSLLSVSLVNLFVT